MYIFYSIYDLENVTCFQQNSGKLRVIVGLSVKKSAILKKPPREKRLLHFFLATKVRMTFIKVVQDTILHFVSNV